MEEEYILSSKRNLQKLLSKINKHKVVFNDFEVELALKGLCVYHGVRQTNILNVLNDGEIKIKKLIMEGELSNSSSDYFHGFDSHLSMSLGIPWQEYGPYNFVFGLDNLSKESMFFFKDPWLWGNKHLEHNFLIKEDFIVFAKELLKRNLYFYSKNIIIKKPFKGDIHTLAKSNFKRFEVKQPDNLKIKDATEFLVWSNFDNLVELFVRLFFHWWFIAFIGAFILIKVMLI